MRPEKVSAEQSWRTGGGDVRYLGVRKRRWGKWVSEIRLPQRRERIWLGSYDAPEKAAHAFDAAAFCLRGAAALLNFPDQFPPLAAGMSHDQIQAVAFRYANEPPPVMPSSGASEGAVTIAEENHSELEEPFKSMEANVDFLLPYEDFLYGFFPHPYNHCYHLRMKWASKSTTGRRFLTNSRLFGASEAEQVAGGGVARRHF